MEVPAQTPPLWQSAQALVVWTPTRAKALWVYFGWSQSGSVNLWQESQVVGMPLAAWGGILVAV